MKTLIVAGTLALFTLGAGSAFAVGCHQTCAKGYTYDKASGSCVKTTVSS